MRNLVQPPLSLRCELCGGELRFKWIEFRRLRVRCESRDLRLREMRSCALAPDAARPLRRARHEERAARSGGTGRAEPAAIDTLDARSRIRLTSLRTRRNGVGGRVHGAARRRRTPPITNSGPSSEASSRRTNALGCGCPVDGHCRDSRPHPLLAFRPGSSCRRGHHVWRRRRFSKHSRISPQDASANCNTCRNGTLLTAHSLEALCARYPCAKTSRGGRGQIEAHL